jgi:hypothetical protein
MQDINDGKQNREEVLAAMKRIEEEEQKLLAGWQTNLDLKSPKDLADEEALDPDTASLLDNAENPPLVKKLWHNAQTAILKNVPQGSARKFVLYEKGVFLRKSSSSTDQKFTFKTAAQAVYDIVDNWVRSGGDPIELGIAFWDLNEENGFHAKKRSTSIKGQTTQLN